MYYTRYIFCIMIYLTHKHKAATQLIGSLKPIESLHPVANNSFLYVLCISMFLYGRIIKNVFAEPYELQRSADKAPTRILSLWIVKERKYHSTIGNVRHFP